VHCVLSLPLLGVNTLKRYVPFGGSSGVKRSRAIVGLSFALLALLGSSFFLYSLTAKHQNAHAAARPAVNSVSRNWYFAEGRVGGGYREYLTMGNPDPTIDCTASVTYLPEGDITDAQAKRHMAALKPLAIKTYIIAHDSRFTASVNQDLQIPEQQQQGSLVSAVVTVSATGGCTGLVVERPMYFNYHGVTSGSDVFGTTMLTQTYYIADVPTSATATSFENSYITVLNPSTTATASAQINYYAGGNNVGFQTLSVAPGARGTIYPGTLPFAHVSAVVTANTPVAVERSSYMHNVQEGIVGSVSSAASVVGAQSLSNDWLFAEGYTGSQVSTGEQSQEYLVISNLTAVATTATMTLEYQSTQAGQPGHHQTVTVTVAANSQVIEDINSLNTNPTGTCDVTPCATTPETSAEVTAPTASLVVERQMFFHYTHTVPSTGVNLTTTGGSDVLGALAAATTSANFAEGYTNTGYNEWLTLQNPTSVNETLALTIVNEYARTYTENIPVTAKSRSTVDITDLVKINLVHAGDTFRGYQVSMSVTGTAPGNTFVAERPMYFSLSEGIQGGSDVVGFTGINSTLPANAITTFSVPTAASNPTGIAQGADGNLWYTENTTNKIGVISPTTGYSQEFTIPTANSGPTGITKGPDGNMWFVETTANKIANITPAGTITEFSAGLSASVGLAQIVAGQDGNLWFTEASATKIGRITLTGTITEYSTGLTTGSAPTGITAGPAGSNTVWFTEAGAARVGSVSTATATAGAITEHGTLSITSSGIALGADGNLWYTEQGTGKVGNILPGTTFTATDFALPGAGNATTTTLGITLGADNTLRFTEQGTSRIGQITTTGSVTVTEFTVPGIGITATAITAGADGNVWFTETNANQIGRIVIG